MRLPEKPSGREPDLLVLLTEHLDRHRVNFVVALVQDMLPGPTK